MSAAKPPPELPMPWMDYGEAGPAIEVEGAAEPLAAVDARPDTSEAPLDRFIEQLRALDGKPLPALRRRVRDYLAALDEFIRRAN